MVSVLAILAAACGAEPGASGRAWRDDLAAGRLGNRPIAEFCLERDLFLPLTDPAVDPASADPGLRPRDEVFGLLLDGEARAYPVHMISYHHVVNDAIHGRPVAVTY